MSCWLPELVLRSVLRDAFCVHLPSLVRWAQAKVRGRRGKDLRSEWAQAIDAGRVRTRAELARREGVSRARVTQVLGPLEAPALQPHWQSGLPAVGRARRHAAGGPFRSTKRIASGSTA